MRWVLIPALALLLLVAAIVLGVGPVLAALCAAGLIGAVMTAVHHAEVVAHRVGEPFGTLVLALAVTVIEASLILAMMFAAGEDAAVLPRDTLYAAVMIILNGVVGLCILVGGLSHHEQAFRVEGSSGALAALIVMASMSLVFPTFTTTTPSGTYSTSQLEFVAATSAALWGIFVFVQTVRHRDYFLSTPRTRTPTRLPRRRGRRPRASASWWCASCRSSGSPRCCRRRSSARSSGPARPRPSSAS